jgi:CubicO group peptidase (beta-lactamase class C family)
MKPLLYFLLLFILIKSSFGTTQEAFSNKGKPSLAMLANEFMEALHTGNRKAMLSFVEQHTDTAMYKRISAEILVTLNLSLWYESAGIGYNLISVDTLRSGQLRLKLLNRLTEASVLVEIPVSEKNRINGLINSKNAESTLSTKPVKSISEAEIVDRIEKCMDLLQQNDEFAGVVVLAKNGKLLRNKAIGYASKSYQECNQTDTKFNLASVGKIFTGVAIARLVEQGKLSFNDTLSLHLPNGWLKPEISHKIQIKHLLTHTSGLGDYFRDIYSQCDIPFYRNLDEYKSVIYKSELSFEPGTRFSYSNTGFILLGVLIEQITGKEYFQFLKDELFLPIGMVNTDGYDKDRPILNRATGYSKHFEQGQEVWTEHTYTRVMKGSPSGGIYSTAEDLMRFDQALRNGSMLAPENASWLTNGRPDLNASFHSMAFFTGDGNAGRTLSHSGDGSGVNCQFKMYLDSGYTYIILSNYSAPSANMVAKVIEQLFERCNSIN